MNREIRVSFPTILTIALLIVLTGWAQASGEFDPSNDGFFSIDQFLCITDGDAPDVTLNWDDLSQPPLLNRSVRTFCFEWSLGDSLCDILPESLEMPLPPPQAASLISPGIILDCYRDPAFDGGREVPAEPASVQTPSLAVNQATPEPATCVMFALGGLALLKRRRA